MLVSLCFIINFLSRVQSGRQTIILDQEKGPDSKVTHDICCPSFRAHLTYFEDMTAVSQYHDIHRAARVPLDPFFSKAGVSRVEPRVLQRIQKLCRRIRAEQGTGEVIN